MADTVFEPGALIDGRFRISEALATGVLGATYKVVDSQTQQYGVLRVLPDVFARRAPVAARYVQAASEFAKLRCPGLGLILGFGKDPAPYVVEQFLDGIPLKQILDVNRQRGHGLKLSDLLPFIDQFVEVLNFVHRKGKVLGGVYPNDLFLVEDKLIFSEYFLFEALPPEALVKIYLRDEDRAHYLAHEFIANPGAMQSAGDIYSVGVLIWELLAGQKFPGEFGPLPATVDKGAELTRVLEKACAEKADDRYPSMSALALELARVAGDKKRVGDLQHVVLMEAKEAAQRAAAREREVSMGDDTIMESLAALPKKEAPVLFEDHEVSHEPAPAPAFAPEVSTPARATPAPAPQAAGSRRTLVIAGVVALIVAGGAAAGFLMGRGGGEPVSAAPTGAKATESRTTPAQNPLKKLADEARAAVQAERSSMDGKVPADDPGWIAGEKSMAEAESQYSASGYEAAIRLYQTALAGYKDASQRMQIEIERAKAEAETLKEVKQQNAARAAAVAVAAKPSCDEDMIAINAGDFTMGSANDDPDRDGWEKSSTKVSTAGYCIDRFEYPNKKGAVPRREASYAEAKAMCAKSGKRLCSEAEWERACKGDKSLRFPYGSKLKQDACNIETSDGSDRDVAASGKFAQCKSALDVYDLSGNVAEWTDSTMDGTSDRILKGGSSSRSGGFSRCASRLPRPGETKLQEFGFRCCTDL